MQVVYEAVCEVFEGEEIPYTNLVSVLSDSAAYMRGKHLDLKLYCVKEKPHTYLT